jgi:hypothetical protein
MNTKFAALKPVRKERYLERRERLGGLLNFYRRAA